MAAAEPRGALSPTDREAAGAVGRLWWVPLIGGIAWLCIALIVLRFDTRSAVAIGTLAGIVVMFAGVNDLVMSRIVDQHRTLYVVLGIALIIVGFIALMSPD